MFNQDRSQTSDCQTSFIFFTDDAMVFCLFHCSKSLQVKDIEHD